jgi:hypothetical protein
MTVHRLHRLLLPVCAALAAGLASCSEPRQAPAPSEDFWSRFSKKHAAWLEPNAPAMSYDLMIQGKKWDPMGSGYAWTDELLIQTWCAPGKDVRFLCWAALATPMKLTSEYRFQSGTGRELVGPKTEADQTLCDVGWLTARCGTAFLTSLHCFARRGLPDCAMIEEKDNLITIRVENLWSRFAWWGESSGSPTYGIHALAGDIGVERRVAALDFVEVKIEADSSLPVHLVERGATGLETEIEFGKPWLEPGDHPVPRQVTVRWAEQDKRCELIYRFAVQQGCWLVQSAELAGPHESLSLRARLSGLRVEPPSEKLFALPVRESPRTGS